MSQAHDTLLADHAPRLLRAEGFDRVFLNPMQRWGRGECVDALGVATRRAGEVLAGDIAVADWKNSREDLMADAKKPWRSGGTRGIGQHRYIFCPAGVLSLSDMTASGHADWGWGLIYADGTTVMPAQRYRQSDIQSEKALLARLLPDSDDAQHKGGRKGGSGGGKLTAEQRVSVMNTLRQDGATSLNWLAMALARQDRGSRGRGEIRNAIIDDLKSGLLPGVVQKNAGDPLRLEESTLIGKD